MPPSSDDEEGEYVYVDDLEQVANRLAGRQLPKELRVRIVAASWSLENLERVVKRISLYTHWKSRSIKGIKQSILETLSTVWKLLTPISQSPKP